MNTLKSELYIYLLFQQCTPQRHKEFTKAKQWLKQHPGFAEITIDLINLARMK